MVKTLEELNQLKTEYETLKNKLNELTDDELKQVTGGSTFECSVKCNYAGHITDCPKYQRGAICRNK